ncbi:hypothetical protein V565_228540, partial [Rhizoctonia solani 123E]
MVAYSYRVNSTRDGINIAASNACHFRPSLQNVYVPRHLGRYATRHFYRNCGLPYANRHYLSGSINKIYSKQIDAPVIHSRVAHSHEEPRNPTRLSPRHERATLPVVPILGNMHGES